MLKKILISLLLFLVVCGISFLAFLFSGPRFPQQTDKIITQVINTELPDLTLGREHTAFSGDVSIWYEAYGDSSHPVVLLIMGHSATSLLWPDYFVQPLVEAGFQVVRFDNRGCGMSDWIEDWDKNSPYTLRDMAKDAMAVLDDMEVEKAHVVGASMGGMIAQLMAINHGERLLSLTSIMSSGGGEGSENIPSFGFLADYLRVNIKYDGYEDMNTLLKRAVGINLAMSGSPERTDVKMVAERTLVDMQDRKGINPMMAAQHSAAIAASGSRLSELSKIQVPTLVIHGKEDPLISVEAGKKYASLIPNVQTLWVENMGHNLPAHAVPEIHKAMLEHFKRVSD